MLNLLLWYYVFSEADFKTFLLVHPRVIEISPVIHCKCSFTVEKAFSHIVTLIIIFKYEALVVFSCHFWPSSKKASDLLEVPQLPGWGAQVNANLGLLSLRPMGAPQCQRAWLGSFISQTSWSSRNILSNNLYLPTFYVVKEDIFLTSCHTPSSSFHQKKGCFNTENNRKKMKLRVKDGSLHWKYLWKSLFLTLFLPVDQ